MNTTKAAVMLVALCLCAGANWLPAQSVYEPYMFTHFAGSLGGPGYADGTGSAARFNSPRDVAVDSSGNVYVADYQNSTIRKITPEGVVTTLAGLAGSSGSADGTGSAARFNRPFDVAVDSAGHVYVADTYNRTIRKITPGGVVSTLTAQLSYSPVSVAVDSAGHVYVADSPYLSLEDGRYYDGNTIRKITPSGVVTTLAGLAGSRGSADGTRSAARFAPSGVAVDAAGNVYGADTGNHTIRKGWVSPLRVFIAPDGSGGFFIRV